MIMIMMMLMVYCTRFTHSSCFKVDVAVGVRRRRSWLYYDIRSITFFLFLRAFETLHFHLLVSSCFTRAPLLVLYSSLASTVTSFKNELLPYSFLFNLFMSPALNFEKGKVYNAGANHFCLGKIMSIL